MSVGFVVVTTMAFVSGLIAAEMDDWKVWVPFVAVAGFATGIAGFAMGMR